jgi:hypothetical protein
VLKGLGYADGILKRVVSERSTGIVGDFQDLERRKAVYGENVKPLPPVTKIWDSFKDEVKNIMWVTIGATAVFAGLCGCFQDGWQAIAEAFFIILISLVIILITSVVDYKKDGRFHTLMSLVKD